MHSSYIQSVTQSKEAKMIWVKNLLIISGNQSLSWYFTFSTYMNLFCVMKLTTEKIFELSKFLGKMSMLRKLLTSEQKRSLCQISLKWLENYTNYIDLDKLSPSNQLWIINHFIRECEVWCACYDRAVITWVNRLSQTHAHDILSKYRRWECGFGAIWEVTKWKVLQMTDGLSTSIWTVCFSSSTRYP